MIFPEKLKELRKQNGYTQEELAEKLNVSRQAVAKWENGKGMPDLQNLITLSRFFQISVDELIGNTVHKTEMKELTLKNKFHLAEIFVFFIGIICGIIAQDWTLGFLAAVLVPCIIMQTEILTINHIARKQKDLVTRIDNARKSLPRNFYGKLINTGHSGEAKRERIREYMSESLMFASLMTLFEVVGHTYGTHEAIMIQLAVRQGVNNLLNFLLTFITTWVVSFILDLFLGERSVRKYRKLTAVNKSSEE